MHQKSTRHLYVVFSATPYKMGRFIRFITHNSYNHVSIAFDTKLNTLYSFARRYKNTPFYGGFVKENGARFEYKGNKSNIKICMLPIEESEYLAVRDRIEHMSTNSELYIYNIFSAAAVPFRRKIKIYNSYTCVEFAVEIIGMVTDRVNKNCCLTVKDIENALKGTEIYCGEFYAQCSEKSEFLEHKSLKFSFFETGRLMVELLRRCIF